MKTSKTRTVRFRRKRSGKTDYKKRLKLVMSGKPRLVVRKSISAITVQLVTYQEKGDKILATIKSSSLKSFGWNYNYSNTPSAYLAGVLIAQKAKELNISEAILDIGLNKSVPGSKLFAVLKGAIDNGLQVPHGDSVLPSDDRVKGAHIQQYAEQLKADEQKYNKEFSGYTKNNCDPTQITKQVEEVKNKIMGA